MQPLSTIFLITPFPIQLSSSSIYIYDSLDVNEDCIQLDSSGVELNNSEIETFEEFFLLEFMYLIFNGSNYVIFVEHKPLA